MDYQLNKVIGTGIHYPVIFSSSKKNKFLETSTGKERINEALHILINTRKGERYNSNEYGCDLLAGLFEPNDSILKSLLAYTLLEAIDRWERRITVTNLKFEDPSDHQIDITVEYIIKATNTPGSYVFPFMRAGRPFSEVIKGKQYLAGI